MLKCQNDSEPPAQGSAKIMPKNCLSICKSFHEKSEVFLAPPPPHTHTKKIFLKLDRHFCSYMLMIN